MGDEDRKPERLSDEDIKRIAKAVLEYVYAEIGQSMVKHLAWLFGAIFAAVLVWIGKEHIDLK